MLQYLYERAKACKVKQKKGWSLVYKVNKLIANICCPCMQYFNQNSGIDEKSELIVSLTSFPGRIHTVWITIATIMSQTYKPKKILLWLAKEQFPNQEQDLPNNLLRLKRRGLEIRFCEDLKPHKKYFYTMQQYPNENVVIVDDDVLYPENLLEQLLETHKEFPNAICCTYAHKIEITTDGNIDRYEKWKSCEIGRMPAYDIMAVGCGGVLYPPQSLLQEVFDKQRIKELCEAMDDLWLKSMSVLKHTPTVKATDGSLIFFDVIGTRKSGLQHQNAGEKKNDFAMQAICGAYPEVVNKIKETYQGK